MSNEEAKINRIDGGGIHDNSKDQQANDDATHESSANHTNADEDENDQIDHGSGLEVPQQLDNHIVPSTTEQPPAPKDSDTPYTIFSRIQIALIVAIASWSASFSGLSSNIYFPSISVIATDLNVTPELINITVTLYLVFQGLSPSVWAPLSDNQGRRVVILVTFVIYLGANIGLALTKSYAQLLILRAVQSSGSASSVAIGAAIVGDVADRASRAGYMGIFGAASLLATALGPVIGGAIAETVGWRSIFWLLVGYGGGFLVFALIFLPETLRTIVGNGAIRPTGIKRSPAHSLWVSKELSEDVATTHQTLPAPRRFSPSDVLQPLLLMKHVKVACCVLYLALHYAVWQMSLTASSTFFARQYGLSELNVGLTYLANGGGCIFGTLASGRLLDVMYRVALKKAEKRGESRSVRIADARLGTCWIFSVVEAAALLVFGWTIGEQVHISVPIIATFFTSASIMSVQTGVQTFLVDSFPSQSASANATLNLARCLLAAGGTSAILPMTNAMGTGWAFTFLCFLCLAANVLIFWQLRAERKKEQVHEVKV